MSLCVRRARPWGSLQEGWRAPQVRAPDQNLPVPCRGGVREGVGRCPFQEDTHPAQV